MHFLRSQELGESSQDTVFGSLDIDFQEVDRINTMCFSVGIAGSQLGLEEVGHASQPVATGVRFSKRQRQPLLPPVSLRMRNCRDGG
jgi:hypothetical protein